MKKTRSKRVTGIEPEYDAGFRSGLSSAVLDAPEESYASRDSAVEAWQGRGPAPIGALQRGYGAEDLGGPAIVGEPEYVPRRGSLRARMGGWPKSVASRVVYGVIGFGVLSVVGIGVFMVRSYFLHDERFLMATSSDIEILGDAHLSRPQVLSVFAGDLDRNIFRVPLAERRADLERLPWVEHAAVMRLLPNRIRVLITERTPVAFVRQGSQIGLVDAGGVLLDMPPEDAGDPHYSFPVLTGVSAGDPLSTRAARMDVYRQFMKELDGGGEKLTNSLSEVDVSNPEDVKALVALGNSDVLVHFGDEAFLKRYKEFAAHLPEWRQQYPKLASADMRYEGQIVLEMEGGSGVPMAGDGSAAVAETAVASPVADAPAVAEVKAPVAETVTATPVAAKVSLANKAVVKKVAAKAIPVKLGVGKPGGKGKAGKSASNEKTFAALAAARKANAKAVVAGGRAQ
jgi:cell division protein FtsQ